MTTRTPGPSSGRQQRTRSSLKSSDYVNVFPGQHTSRRSSLQCELQAQVTLNEDANQRAVITMNSNQPRYTFLCEPTVSSAREGCQQVGINGQLNHLFTPGCWRWHVGKG